MLFKFASSSVFLALAALSTLTEARPSPPVDILPKNPTAPLRLESASKSVLIVGGGLAGLSAALELSERGYNVTIREANSVVGGRVMGYKTTVDYPQAPLTPEMEFNVEHGFHAFFHNYHNLKNIRDRLNINDYFRPWNKVTFLPTRLHCVIVTVSHGSSLHWMTFLTPYINLIGGVHLQRLQT